MGLYNLACIPEAMLLGLVSDRTWAGLTHRLVRHHCKRE